MSSRVVKWLSLDMADGLWSYAKLSSGLKIYVRPDGTWFITQHYPKFKQSYKSVKSDHNTRGTNHELGKQAAMEYLQGHQYIWR